MAGAGADFTIRLVDKMTGPARAASKAANDLGRALTHLRTGSGGALPIETALQRMTKNLTAMRSKILAAEGALNKLGGGKGNAAQISASKAKVDALTSSYQKQQRAIQRVAQAGAASGKNVQLAKVTKGGSVSTVGDEAGGLKEAMFGGMTGATLMAGAIQKCVGLAFELARAVAGVAIGFAKAALSSAMFLSQQKAGYEMVMGSAAAGAKELEWARKAAVQYGLSVEDTIVQYKQLLGMKLGQEMSQNLIKMTADMQAFGLSSEQTSGVMRQLMQIMSKGKLQGEELMVLAENGISIDLIYKNLAKNLGKTVDEVRKMQAAGELKSGDAMKAVEATILEMTGGRKLGDAASKAAQTFAGSWNKVKSKVQDVLLSIGAKLLPVLEAKIMPMIGQLMGWLDSAEGGKFIDGLVEGLTKVVEMAANLGKSLSAADITGMLMGMVTIINGVASAFVWLASNGTTVKVVLYALGSVLAVVAAACVAIGAAIAIVAAPIYLIIQAINDVIAAWNAFVGSFSSGGASLNAAGQGLGASLASGMQSGIAGGASSVIQAAMDMASNAVGAAKRFLGIASPSRVFAGIGENVALGMAGGIQNESPTVGSAAAGMLDPKKFGGRTTNNSISAPSKIHISIPAAADPQATAAAVYATLETKLAGIIQDAALSVSVVGAA